jgi:O-antigen/teichoic acid export membrane protein
MSRSLKRFGAFLVGNLIQKLGQFLLIPLLAPITTAAEFSRFGLFASVVTFAALVGSLNVHQSIGRTYFDVQDPYKRATVLVSSLVFGLLFGGTLILLTAGIVQASGLTDPLSMGRPEVLVITGTAALAVIGSQFGAVLLRVIDRPGAFAIVSAAQGLLLPAAFLILIKVGVSPLWSAYGSYAIAQLSTALAGLWVARSHLTGGAVSARVLAPALDYSLGTTVHQLVNWVTLQSGRWIGALAVPLSALGGYTMFSFAVMASTMVSSTTYEARRVEILSGFARGDVTNAVAKLRQLLVLNLVLTGVMFLAGLAAFLLQGLVLSSSLHVPLNLVLLWAPLNLLQVLHNNNYWIAVGLHRTRNFATWEVPGAAAGLIATVVLVRLVGVGGLVLGGIVGSAIQAAVSTAQTRRELGRLQT